MSEQIEPLEGRRLLSTTGATSALTNGTLTVTGTAHADAVTVKLSEDGTTYTVTTGIRHRGTRRLTDTNSQTYTASDVTAISIDTGRGNDAINIQGTAKTSVAVPVTVLAGAGSDLVRGGGTGVNTIDGGDGNDTLTGGSGNDVITGDDGDDDLYGLAGKDGLDGGAGSDVLVGGRGIDTLTGGDDDDTLKAQGDGSADVVDGGTDSAATGEDDQDLAIVDTTDTVTNATSDTSADDGDDNSGGNEAGTPGPGDGFGGGNHFGGPGFGGHHGRGRDHGDDSTGSGSGDDSTTGSSGDDSVTGGSGDDTTASS